MTEHALKIISDDMSALGVNYEFMTYDTKPIQYPYFVGEYQEIEPENESGEQESLFIITGYSRATWSELEVIKNKIANLYNRVTGKIVIVEDGSSVAIFYANSQVLRTGDAELKKIQINLNIKEWSVN